MIVEPMTVRMDPADIMRQWAPGSRDESWTWDDELADIEAREPGVIEPLAEDMVFNGQLEPVVLGGRAQRQRPAAAHPLHRCGHRGGLVLQRSVE